MKKAFRSTLIIAGLFLASVPVQSFAQIVATTFATGLTNPKTIISDGSGNLVVTDFGVGTAANSSLDLISPAGVVTFLTPGNAGLLTPYGLVSLGGLYYVTNFDAGSIVTVNPTTGVVTPFPTTGVALSDPSTLLADSSGNLYVFQSGPSIVKIPTTGPSAGVATLLATLAPDATAMAFGRDGNIYITSDQGVSRMTLAGVITPFVTSNLFSHLQGIAQGPDNNFYVSDIGNNTVFKVTTAGLVSVYATGFSFPSSLSFSGANLFVSNDTTGTISRLPAPPPAPVPTLSGWAMILAGLLLGGTGVVFAARQALSGRMSA